MALPFPTWVLMPCAGGRTSWSCKVGLRADGASRTMSHLSTGSSLGRPQPFLPAKPQLFDTKHFSGLSLLIAALSMSCYKKEVRACHGCCLRLPFCITPSVTILSEQSQCCQRSLPAHCWDGAQQIANAQM